MTTPEDNAIPARQTPLEPAKETPKPAVPPRQPVPASPRPPDPAPAPVPAPMPVPPAPAPAPVPVPVPVALAPTLPAAAPLAQVAPVVVPEKPITLIKDKIMMPPAAVWTLAFAMTAWGIDTFVPSAYQLACYGLWLVIAIAARAAGVNMQTVYQLGQQFGVGKLPATSLLQTVDSAMSHESLHAGPALKVADDQHRIRRWLV